uniref:Alpha-amylase n=1 Tax=Periplaneta americana TaxID=6978 RepID=A0A0F7J1J1_PERAM|nr:alpha-amylase [Periplaneta americana]
MKLFALLALVVLLAGVQSQKDPKLVPDESTLLRLFEWKFDDIADECERFLAPKGYAGVQVSPVHKNLLYTATAPGLWERYQPMSYKLVSRSGDETAFRDMVRRCNAVGVRIYVDVVLNHMSGNWDNAVGTGGSTADTYNYSYPGVPYDHSDFHPYCILNDYQDPEIVRNCELVGLHDLDQSQDYVREKLIDFLNHLVDAGVAGFRVDAAKHMWPADLEYIYGKVNNRNSDAGYCGDSSPSRYQEVIDLGGEAVSKFEYNGFGRVTEFKHSEQIGYAFRGNNRLEWTYTYKPNWGLLPSGDALVFVDNHDNQRGGGNAILTYKTPKNYKMAIAFILAHPYGYPRVMSSFDFEAHDQGPPQDSDKNILSPSINADGTCGNGWVCEHRWRQHANMVGFRNAVRGTEITNWWDNGNHQIGFCRGDRGFVAFNVEDNDLKQTLQTCLPAGTYCDVISGSKNNRAHLGAELVVAPNGEAFSVRLISDDDGVLAIHLEEKL